MTNADTLFTIDEETRTATGLLVPYGELTDPRHRYPAIFHRDTVTVPGDLSILRANREHELTDPVATFASTEETDKGLVATFTIARTPEGDELIEQHREGKLTRLSAEFRNLVKRGSEVVSATLTGAAFTSTPAFASAGLFTLDAIDEQPEGDEDETPETDETTDTEGDTSEEEETTDEAPASEDDDAAEGSQEGAFAMSTAVVPNTAAGKQSSRTAPAQAGLDSEGLFALIHRAIVDRDADAMQELREDKGKALFALTDVKISGTNQVGTAAIQPQYVGELWRGKSYVQKFLPSFGAPSPLSSPVLSGWRWTTPPTVATWTGNKTAIPSGSIATGAQAGVMQRFAAGHDLAREFYDFPAGAEVVASYIRALVESYAKVSDLWFRDQVIALAGAQENYSAVGVPADVSPAWAKVVQGALSVIAGDNTPSFAWVAPDVFKSILLTRSDDSSAFLSAAMGFEGGRLETFPIIPTSGLPTGAVLVGAKEAVQTFQLPGSPIRVNALDIVNGGQDEAVFGYVGYIDQDSADGLALIDDAA